MHSYRLLDRSIAAVDADFNTVLAVAHANRSRVSCMCRSDQELPLYIAKRQSGYVLGRWPGTGPLHAADCDHYEAPDALTGLGQVRGNAVQDDPETGDVRLTLAFPLKRGSARAAPAAITNDKPALKHNGRKLSMRGLLHVLWDKAELTHWYPRMVGKRNWWIVRRELLEAVENCWAKGVSLGPRVFIPEVFRQDDLAGLAGRRYTALAPARASTDTMMIVIGEIKSVGQSRYGEAVTLRHLADWPLYLDVDTAKRFHRRFAKEEELWRSSDKEDGHLILAASFSLKASGAAEMFDIALMPVTPEWLPYENLAERELLRLAVAERRRFVKGMRVDLESIRPIASITLTDTTPYPAAVHLAREADTNDDDENHAAFIATAGVDHHPWKPGMNIPEPGHLQRANSHG